MGCFHDSQNFASTLGCDGLMLRARPLQNEPANDRTKQAAHNLGTPIQIGDEWLNFYQEPGLPINLSAS